MQVPGINGMNHHIDTMIQASINKELIVYGVRFWGFQALRRFQWKMEKFCIWHDVSLWMGIQLVKNGMSLCPPQYQHKSDVHVWHIPHIKQEILQLHTLEKYFIIFCKWNCYLVCNRTSKVNWLHRSLFYTSIAIYITGR